MKRILICSTILTTIKAFLVPHIQLLKSLGYAVDVCGKKDTAALDQLVDHVYDLPFQRTPFSRQNIIAGRKLAEIVSSNGYDVIHFHTPVASAFGRWAARKFRGCGAKVLYTAHGFHFFRGAPLINWLVYYPIEKFLSRYTDLIITINREDYKRARTFQAGRIEYVPGVGLDTDRFSEAVVDRPAKRSELGVPEDALVILSVGELNRNKNHAAVIKAVAKLNNPSVFYLICGTGPLERYLRVLSNELGVAGQVKLLGFRNDIAELCKTADIFAFPSRREGLGVAALEAMAAGLPLVTSNVHGIVDYSINGVTGYSCEPGDVTGFADAIAALADNGALRLQMGKHNAIAVQRFKRKNVDVVMNRIYAGLADKT